MFQFHDPKLNHRHCSERLLDSYVCVRVWFSECFCVSCANLYISVCVYIWMWIFVSLSVCLFVCIFAHVREYTSMCGSACASFLSTCPPVCMSMCLHLGLCAGHLAVRMCVWTHVYMYVCFVMWDFIGMFGFWRDRPLLFPASKWHLAEWETESLCHLYLCHLLLCSSLCATLAVCSRFDISQVGLDSTTFCLTLQ